ncbi:MAG TPA: TPM domain-containing protein [Rhodoblastus sp.]|nr:TPM domain-containing protein [Rhodoblastus sp.]
MMGVLSRGRSDRRRIASLKARGPVAVAFAAFIALFATLAFALDLPALTGRVVDQANIIPAATRAQLETKLASLEDKSGIQLVVATVPSLQGSDIETFSVDLARAWKLGEAKKNNGLLLLVAPNERKVRIEVGYGLEGTITDALSSVIIRSAIVPKFRSGDYAGGVVAGVDAIIDALTVDSAEWQKKAKVRVEQQPDLFDQLLPFIIFLLFVFILISMIRNARGQTGRWVRRGNQTIFIPSGPSSWSGGGGWGGSGGGDFGGGFSGGGGSFGGGGASGDW